MRERLAQGMIRGAKGGDGGGSGGGLTPTIDQYVTDVNAVRSSNLSSTQETALDEFWRRLGNRDGELSTDRQPDLAECFVTQARMNVDQGNTVFGLSGNVDLSVVGSPTFGSTAYTCSDASTSLNAPDGESLVTTSTWTCITHAEGYAPGGEGRAMRIATLDDIDLTPGRTVFSQIRSNGEVQTILNEGGSGDLITADISISPGTTYATILDGGVPEITARTMSGGTLDENTFESYTIDTSVDFSIFNEKTLESDRHYLGDLRLFMAFESDISTDLPALDTIINETLLA